VPHFGHALGHRIKDLERGDDFACAINPHGKTPITHLTDTASKIFRG
jgi:hypothetical protein